MFDRNNPCESVYQKGSGLNADVEWTGAAWISVAASAEGAASPFVSPAGSCGIRSGSSSVALFALLGWFTEAGMVHLVILKDKFQAGKEEPIRHIKGDRPRPSNLT
jgi:hypothetical protein